MAGCFIKLQQMLPLLLLAVVDCLNDVQSSLVEKQRSVQRTVGEYTFNIFYYLIAGCSGKLR